MGWATSYPEIAAKVGLGCLFAFLALGILVLAGRRIPRIRIPLALGFGIAIGFFGSELHGQIRQQGLDDQVRHAAIRGDFLELKKALDAGGSPNADDPRSGGYPALTDAIESGHPEVVELLLQRGANTGGSWVYGSNLDHAAKKKRPDLALLLQRYGAR